MINVLIADDHSIARLGIKVLVKDVLGNCTVDFADNGESLIKMIKAKPYDILIKDVNMPQGEGVISISKILSLQPDVKILVISVNQESIFARRYLRSGAFGYLQKSQPDEEIMKAIRTISLGKRYYSTELMMQLSEIYLLDNPENPFDKLSDREFEVVILLLKGFSLNDVANTLHLHTSTASTHKSRLFEKLGITNMVELVSLATLHEIIKDQGK